MVSKESKIEPIIPMGILMIQMGCKMKWEHNKMTLEHPSRGRLEVDTLTSGCPQVSRELALSLIDEWEGRVREKKVKSMTVEDKADLLGWMK